MQERFETAHGFSSGAGLERLSVALPHTRAWLALASGLLPALDAPLLPATVLAECNSHVEEHALPAALRTGRNALPIAAPGGTC